MLLFIQTVCLAVLLGSQPRAFSERPEKGILIRKTNIIGYFRYTLIRFGQINLGELDPFPHKIFGKIHPNILLEQL